MTKNIYIISIILMSLIGLFLVSILVTGIIHGNGFFSIGTVDKIENNIRKQEQYNLQETNKLTIELIASDLNIILTDDQELKVIQYSNNELENEELFKVNTTNDTLKISENGNNNIFWWHISNSSAYDLYLPKNYKQELTIKTISGEITINGDLDLEQAQINTTSGNIETGIIKVNSNLGIKTISGEITVTDIEASKVDIGTTSGDIKVDDIIADSNIHSISGSVNLERMVGGLKLGTTSGDVRINNYDLKKDSTITSISGEVYISLVPNTNCEIETSSISGDISLPNNSSRIGNAPYNKLTIKTTSGDIEILVNEDL